VTESERQTLLDLGLPEDWIPLFRFLRAFDIRICVDDSGSMMSSIDPKAVGKILAAKYNIETRWDLAKAYTKVLTQIALLFDSNGPDIDFLNRSDISNVTSMSQIDDAMAADPTRHDLTPLCEAFDAAADAANRAPVERPLLTIFLSDGAPSDGDLGSKIRGRNGETMFVILAACTDNKDDVAYFDDIDKNDATFDVLGPFMHEKKQVSKVNKIPYSIGHHFARMLLDIVVPEFDSLDEKKVDMAAILEEYN
jgi:hypothetical protein